MQVPPAPASPCPGLTHPKTRRLSAAVVPSKGGWPYVRAAVGQAEPVLGQTPGNVQTRGGK